jgi:HD-GYP domain-containing protein (c-di-GMP phosphodiesterase class II)
LTTIAEIASIATHRTRLREQTERRLHQVQALHAIDLAIASNKDLRTTLDIFLGHVTAQMQVEAAAILLVNAPALTLEYAAVRGLSQSIGGASLRIGEGYAGWVVRECRPLLIRNLAAPEVPSADAQELLSRGFISYYAAPLLVGGQTRGVLEIFHRAPFDPDAERLEFLQSLIAQAAIAIDQADLLDHLRHSSLDLALAYDATIEGWSRALDLRDQETEGHSRRMTEVTLKLARALGVPEDDLPHIRRGVLLHDIGKIAIPDSILLKPGPLTDAEWDIMRQHPVYAYQLLSPVDYLRPALDIPYCHHEKWDGTGYPRGLKGEQIPLAARLFAVVDVWDALSSDRPYRRAWPPERVLEYLACQAGKHFDPRVLETFLKLTYGRNTAPQDNANLHESPLTQTLSS